MLQERAATASPAVIGDTATVLSELRLNGQYLWR